jgi:2-phospho-L-lactate guanylyltransferase
LHAVLPVKGFGHAKTRLASALDAEARATLARRLFERALDALQGCSALAGVLVATDGADVAELCHSRGVALLRDPPHARLALPALVDRALHESARRGAASALVLMADLPLVTSADITHLLAAPTSADVVLVSDRRGRGTNALRLPLARGFCSAFGHPDSKRMHLQEAARVGLSTAVIECDGIALDLDHPSELAEALAPPPAC